MNNFRLLMLSVLILLGACSREDNLPQSEQENQNAIEQNLSFSYENSLKTENGIIVRYKFTENKKLVLSKQFEIPSFSKDDATKENQEKLRKLIEKLITSNALPYVKYAYIHVGKKSGGENLGGFVGYMKDDLKEMYLSINLHYFVNDLAAGNGLKRTMHTIVHEYGHTVAENISQIIPTPNAGSSCNTVTNADTNACTKDKSYINTFYNKFWKPTIDEYNANPEEYFKKHPNNFVSSYASSNYGEDVAESFTSFVLEKKPSGNLIKDQKVSFFYSYPELVKMRTEIRKGL